MDDKTPGSEPQEKESDCRGPKTRVEAPQGEKDAAYDEASHFADIFRFLESKEYPSGSSKNDKRNIRQKASSFCIRDSALMHIGHKGRVCRLITDVDERTRIVAHLHAGKNRPVFNQVYL